MAANQGSRAGLITTVVILSIVSVVAVIFAFWYGAEKRRVDQEMVDYKKRYQDFVSDQTLASKDVADLKALRQEQGTGFTPQMKVFDVALAQRDQLVKTITGKDAGQDNTPAMAAQRATATLAAATDAVKSANTRLPSTSDDLVGAVSVLADKVKLQAGTIADRDGKLQEAEARALDTIKQKDADLAARDAQIAQIRSSAEQVQKTVQDSLAQGQATVADIEKSRDEERLAAQNALAKKDVEVSAKNAEVKRLEDRMKNTQARMDRIRVSVTSPILRHGDGMISDVTGKDIVYINLGRGKQVVPGLTFEVYDRNRGIPKMGDPLNEEQPAGKASIEVLKVLDDTSECRVTRLQAGQQVTNGDIILNVVYDPSIKYNFVVFGRFDLDQNGVPTLQDSAIVKRLITQWGARVMDKIDADTDFLVLGKEPVVPVFSPEELADPVNIKKQADAQRELDEYLNTIQTAKELHIPILNQNRFIYFTGQENMVGR